MISRIQNVSFTGARQRVANKVFKDFEEAYVSVSSNLHGTANEVKAARLLRDAEFSKDKDTFVKSVASVRNSNKNIQNVSGAKVKEVEQILTTEEIAAAQDLKNEHNASNFFG